ncbi:MAG: peptidase U32 family protein, partial [Desulfitobacteriaceae bacterium]
AGASAIWRMPRILNQEQSRLWLKRLEEASAWPKRPTVMVSNLGQLELLRLLDPAWPFEVDYSLNVFNEASLYHFFKQGAGMIALSPELHHEQIRPLAHWPKVEVLAFGDLELMVSEYCPVGATRGGKKGESCTRPCVKDSHHLRDRLKYDFPLETDQECRMHLFNVKRLNLYQELEQLAGMGVASVRLQLVRENPKEVLEVVKLFTVAWDKIMAGRKLDPAEIAAGSAALEGMFTDGFTKGHFFRGVL